MTSGEEDRRVADASRDDTETVTASGAKQSPGSAQEEEGSPKPGGLVFLATSMRRGVSIEQAERWLSPNLGYQRQSNKLRR